jgi:hypothetical protein
LLHVLGLAMQGAQVTQMIEEVFPHLHALDIADNHFLVCYGVLVDFLKSLFLRLRLSQSVIALAVQHALWPSCIKVGIEGCGAAVCRLTEFDSDRIGIDRTVGVASCI